LSNNNNEVKTESRKIYIIGAIIIVVAGIIGYSIPQNLDPQLDIRKPREPLYDVYRSECGVSAVRAGLIIGGEEYRRSEYPW